MRQYLSFLGVVLLGFAGAAMIVVFGLQKQNSAPPPGPLPPAKAADTSPPPASKLNEAFNSDGSLKLTLKSTTAGGETNYNLWASKADGSDRKILFSKTLSNGSTLAIPQNSWSPDNKEVFLIQKDGSLTGYLVFRASGEDYPQGDKFLEVTSFFTKSNNKLTLRNVTGWDGYGLLHIETANPDGTRGPRFWFVTGTRTFLQLIPAPNE